jgi:hypothetical protein
MTSLVPQGTPPQSVIDQQLREAALSRAEIPPLDMEDIKLAVRRDIPVAPAARPTEMVELTYVPDRPEVPSFRIKFPVLEVCERDHYVSLLLVSETGFTPTAMMKFDLTYKRNTVPVIFAGAEFEFQTISARGISFLVDQARLKQKS